MVFVLHWYIIKTHILKPRTEILYTAYILLMESNTWTYVCIITELMENVIPRLNRFTPTACYLKDVEVFLHIYI